MNSHTSDEERRKTYFQSEPLCLFCFPDEISLDPPGKRTYVNAQPKRQAPLFSSRKRRIKDDCYQVSRESKCKGKEDTSPKKRTEARIIRRKMREPIKHLKSYLFASVNYEKVPEKKVLPSLFEVLETVKDAWPPPPPPPLRRNFSLYREEDAIFPVGNKQLLPRSKMKEEMYLQFPSPLINRRFSMPEVLMRKYFITKEKTSEESETVKTMDEITPTTGSTLEDTTRTSLRVKSTMEIPESPIGCKASGTQNERMVDATQQTNESELWKPKTVSQVDYCNQGGNIIVVKNKCVTSECTCTCNCAKANRAEAQENGTSAPPKSEPSSPVQLLKPETSSGTVSSESESGQHTHRDELTSSKETSTDVYHSGKSTLSQTVSDKSFSTQDSTVSVKSVSTGGSQVTDNSNATTPDIEKTSAKESITSDCSSRSPTTNSSRKNRKRDKYSNEHKKCFRYHDVKHSIPHSKQCLVHSNRLDDSEEEGSKSRAINSDCNNEESFRQANNNVLLGGEEEEEEIRVIEPPPEQRQPISNVYTWTKLSKEELYMMQQLRHQKLLESKYSEEVECEEEKGDMSLEYVDVENQDQSIMIPRYSALPRSLSMLVNTSSAENSFHNSDSDNQSLADSLEDQPVTRVCKSYYDTKKESKPVRGDVPSISKKVERPRAPKGQAFFVDMEDPLGESKKLEDVEKLPEPPDKIKNQISERHKNVTANHKNLHEFCKEEKAQQRRKKSKTVKNGGSEASARTKAMNRKEQKEQVNKKISHRDVTKKEEGSEHVEKKKPQRSEEEGRQKKKTNAIEFTSDLKNSVKRKKEVKQNNTAYKSKIPILVSCRSTTSSDGDGPHEGQSGNSQIVEKTEILEITQSGQGITLQKPQEISYTLPPTNMVDKNHLVVPPMSHTLRTQPVPDYSQIISRAQFLGQMRRSPILKYRQRFEVIPEEKSSSLSSAEEKPAEETKFRGKTTSSTVSTKEENPENIKFESYNLSDLSNIVVAQVGEDQQLKTLPAMIPKGADEQKIILFSSKSQNSNSSKGRDALIAMNREDFNRLAKGWMNFYMLREFNETPEIDSKRKSGREDGKNTSNRVTSSYDKKSSAVPDCGGKSIYEGETKRNDSSTDLKENGVEKKREKTVMMPETGMKNKKKLEACDDIRYHSSNTTMRRVKPMSPSNSTRATGRKKSYLPELNLTQEKVSEGHRSTSTGNLTLPQVVKHVTDSDEDSDSDSTDYLEPPSPRVPPLLLEDCPSDATLSSSDSEIGELRHQVSHLKKHSDTNRPRLKRDFFETSDSGKKKNPGWSVTVAGTVELSKSAPDLEMRLSFPKNAGAPLACQSDTSCLSTEFSSCSKFNGSMQDLNVSSSRNDSLLSSDKYKQNWTVENQNRGVQNRTKPQLSKNQNQHLPNLDSPHNRNSKKVLKRTEPSLSVRRLVKKKLYNIWPALQNLIQKEFLNDGFITDLPDDICNCCLLSVRGTAISLEKKEKPLTMTERDITRRSTSRI